MEWTNLPPGATHIGPGNTFYKKYSLGWLRWDYYHKGWSHTDAIVQVEAL